MTEEQNFSAPSVDPEDLQKQVLDLRRQLAEAQARNRAMWNLLAEISQRLQASSTSIKAAVSSLLDYDIFWDGSTQHEFLETIDDSVEQGASLILLMTLAFRSEASRLEIKPEPHTLQEILSTVLDTIALKTPGHPFKADFPPEGQPVWVDYGYLAVALRLLLEVMIEPGTTFAQIELLAVETQDCWWLNIAPIAEPISAGINHIDQDRFDELVAIDNLSPENVLKLFTAARILRLQNIRLDVETDEASNVRLRLRIPVVTPS